MNGNLAIEDIYELLMLDNKDWLIANNSLNRFELEPNYIIEKPKVESIIEPIIIKNDIIEEAKLCANQAKNISELNNIIANNSKFNIITNNKISNFFKYTNDNSDLLIINSQKNIKIWLEQIKLENHSLAQCSLSPVATPLLALQKKQEPIYLPFIQKFIEFNKPKAILTFGTTASQYFTNKTFANNINKVKYNEYSTIFSIYNTDNSQKIWFTILDIKHYLSKER